MPVASASETAIVAARASELARAGQRHYADGRYADAVDRFRSALAVAEAATEADRPTVEMLADLHAKLANALFAAHQFAAAADSYKAALRLIPWLTNCWCNLASTYLRLGKPKEAIALFLQALELSPGHWPSRTNLVQALVADHQLAIARTLLLELIAERPRDAALRHELGKVCHALGDVVSALAQFEIAVGIDPGDACSLYWIGSLRQKLGDDAAAAQAYAEAARLEPLIRRPAARGPARFRVLAIYAPFGGNTPADFLFSDADYDIDTIALLSAAELCGDIGDGHDVVVNLVSDADQAPQMMQAAAVLAAKIAKPTVNAPAKVMRTARDEVSAVLREIPWCRVPSTIRLAAGGDPESAVRSAALAYPLLARPAGTHGGESFEKLGDPQMLAAYFAGSAGGEHYLIEYLDYRSDDGLFRKYRLIFVGGDVLPYHLAIGPDWKLHRDSTEMAHHPWMQQEEERFLRDPWSVFGAPLQAALRSIRDSVGLDYFGIDCGIDRDGRLVVFEVNASMLVHDEDGALSYKRPYIRRIKAAFDAMLARLAAT